MIRVSYKLINLNNMKDLLYYITAFLLGITNTLCFAQQVDVSTAIETAEVFMGASVKTNGNSHLPEIQSATDMQQNGVNMSEFQIQLLQKIEELTLYIIKQEDKISQQEKRIQELENTLNK